MVRAVRLAARIRKPVDRLKMDVEGAEYDVFLDLYLYAWKADAESVSGKMENGERNHANQGMAEKGV